MSNKICIKWASIGRGTYLVCMTRKVLFQLLCPYIPDLENVVNLQVSEIERRAGVRGNTLGRVITALKHKSGEMIDRSFA